MKPYIIGAVIVWPVCGVAGAWLLGQQRVYTGTIAAGPLTLYDGLDKKPTDA